MHFVREYIARFCEIKDQDWAEIEPKITRKEYLSGEALLRPGDYCKKLYFLESGFNAV